MEVVWGAQSTFQYLKGPDREAREDRIYSDRTVSNEHKLKDGKFRLDIKKKIFTVRVVRRQNSLPRDVDALTMAVLKARLDEQCGLIW